MMDEKEMYQRLLAQIDLQVKPEDLPKIQTGLLEKVIVHKESRRYEFRLRFPQILPAELYQQFSTQLYLAFQEIAAVEIKIAAESPAYDQALIQEYWTIILQQPSCKTPILKEAMQQVTPVIDEHGQIILKVAHEGILPYLKEHYLAIMQDAYSTFGFPPLRFEVRLDQEQAKETRENFAQQKAERDAKMQEVSQQAIALNQEKQKKRADKKAQQKVKHVQIGRVIADKEIPTPMEEITEEERRVLIEGVIFNKEVRDLRSGRKILILKMTDYTSSFSVKKFSNNEDDEAQFAALEVNQWIRVRGSVQEDTFMRDLVVNAQDIGAIQHPERMDHAEEKRSELHLHTNMSQMDATNTITDYVKTASRWGFPAVAVTDHAAAQSFPEAYQAGEKYGVKILYGVEANVVDDHVPIAYNEQHLSLSDATYVVFDVETTGLSAVYDVIIELAAVKMHKGNVIDSFEEFIDPGRPLSPKITELTSITDEMLRGQKKEDEVLKRFAEWSKDTILVAHNATFDIGFLNMGYKRIGLPETDNPVIDTLEFSRFLNPQYKTHTLNVLAKKFKVVLEQHHRAVYDSETTGRLAWIFIEDAAKRYDIHYHNELNEHVGEGDAYKRARPFHAILMAQTQAGLKNLFKLISASNIDYFYRVPRIPRALLSKYREGILVGSACAEGEVFTAMLERGIVRAKQLAKFYDYLEVQPKAMYQPLLNNERVKSEKDLEEIVENFIKIGRELDKPVVVTGDAHYLNPEDHIYREVLINSMPNNPLNRTGFPEAHFRTTEEMLADFSYLPEDVAKEIVIDNPNKIAAMCEKIVPVKDKLYTPKIPGSDDEITKLSYDKAHELYGDPLPEIVEKRLAKELHSIIENGFSVIYLIAQKLVHKSLSDGYLVGSRGSVGSSFVATMSGITEVNPLPPHYRCPKCHYSKFYEDGSFGSGFDMPEKDCPECGTSMVKDGHDIPFETFLGFHGDKVPDIDLNFSGAYQPQAHNYTKVLFGEDYVYRAGTIGTVADKTAFGFVKAYERDHDLHYRGAEIDRLAKGATGVKRTTGQHPGGIIVIPDYMDVYDFTPIQFPADDRNAEWRTTHFDFHSIHDNILKLDILGHDDPTVIRMLQDLSGIDPKTIRADDPEIMKIFEGTEVLGVTPEQIYSNTGTLGIPEFGTRFVRGMLEETHPSTFAELLQISGLSHGTDVWLGNAEELIRAGKTTLAEVIGCRDDIMVYLLHAGLEDSLAFQIMEHVRKGKGIPDEWQAEMRKKNVPEWYIASCLKIKYMFPKAHAAAYVLMALRVAYFKVYFPILYYCAYLSVRGHDFEPEVMSQGNAAVKRRMKEIKDKGLDASKKEKDLMTVLEIVNEMQERGIEFKMIDIYRSDAANFVIDGDSLIAPFRAIPGLGANVAQQIVQARQDSKFLSKEDLMNRGKVSKTLIEYMTENHVLDGLPDENQLSLF